MKDERSSASGPKTEIQYRFSGGDTDATKAYARELIEMRPAVILAITNTSIGLSQTASWNSSLLRPISLYVSRNFYRRRDYESAILSFVIDFTITVL
jgi:hypothetical protein